MDSTSIYQKIRNLLKWGRVSRPGDDVADIPVQQVSYLGKVADAVMWFPFGFHANVPADELAVLMALQGNPEARIGLPGSPQSRPRVVAGEVVVYHPSTGASLKFNSDGTITITSIGVLTINAPQVTMNGNLFVNGTAVVTGNVFLFANVSATFGTAAFGAAVTAAGTSIGSTHAHSGVTPGVGTSGPPV